MTNQRGKKEKNSKSRYIREYKTSGFLTYSSSTSKIHCVANNISIIRSCILNVSTRAFIASCAHGSDGFTWRNISSYWFFYSSRMNRETTICRKFFFTWIFLVVNENNVETLLERNFYRVSLLIISKKFAPLCYKSIMQIYRNIHRDWNTQDFFFSCIFTDGNTILFYSFENL